MTSLDDTESKSLDITALISSAVHDDAPRQSLPEITSEIIRNDQGSLLDPLNIVHILLSCPKDGVDELLSLVANSCSPKEVIIAAQEFSERLEARFEEEDADSTGHASYLAQLVLLINLYAVVIPRLKPRKSTSETIEPIFSELGQLVSSMALEATVPEGRALIASASTLVKNTALWMKKIAEGDPQEVARSSVIMSTLLDVVIEACSEKICSSIAQRTFQRYYPRLMVRNNVPSDWEDGEQAMSNTLEACGALGRTPQVLESTPSIVSLVLLAHVQPAIAPTVATLNTIFPAILTSIQSNIALDESLAFLLMAFIDPNASATTPASPTPRRDISLDILVPLTTLLPPLCCAHPDPPTRHLTFRLLHLVLDATPPALRLQILNDLLEPSEEAFPQMRSAAIGLVKTSFLRALQAKVNVAVGTDVFLSPVLLQTVGRYVFRADPPDLFENELEVDAFMESTEPARLVECLGLYYVLVLRDVDNMTGIRDPDLTDNIEKSFLGPLRSTLIRWLEDPTIAADPHQSLSLAPLQTNVERIDEALAKIKTLS